MFDFAPVPERNSLGRVVDGRLVITFDDISRARAGANHFGNVFLGRGIEADAFDQSLTFDVAVCLARETGAVVIVKRDDIKPMQSSTIASVVGSVVRVLKQPEGGRRTSLGLDVVQINPSSVTWADDGSAVIWVRGSSWRLILNSIGRSFLRAWQSGSHEEFHMGAQAVSSLPDPAAALLVHAVARNIEPRELVTWALPYESVADEIARRLSDVIAWQRVCEVAGELEYRKDFCRNLARLPTPGAHDAAKSLARKFNHWNWTESAVLIVPGAAAVIGSYVRFAPFETRSLWGWGLLIGGFLIMGCGVRWLVTGHVSIDLESD